MVDKFYNCTIDHGDGLCILRRDNTDYGDVPVNDDRVTLIKHDRATDTMSRYAKSKEQKIKMLLWMKEDDTPRDAYAKRAILVAWPGKWSQDIFYVRRDHIDKYLAKLGYEDDEAKRKRLAAELDVARNIRRNVGRQIAEVQRMRDAHLSRMRREHDEAKRREIKLEDELAKLTPKRVFQGYDTEPEDDYGFEDWESDPYNSNY